MMDCAKYNKIWISGIILFSFLLSCVKFTPPPYVKYPALFKFKWSSGISANDIIIDGGKIYLATKSGLVVLNGQEGKVDWQIPIAGKYKAGILLWRDNLLFVDIEKAIGISLMERRIKWTFSISGKYMTEKTLFDWTGDGIPELFLAGRAFLVLDLNGNVIADLGELGYANNLLLGDFGIGLRIASVGGFGKELQIKYFLEYKPQVLYVFERGTGLQRTLEKMTMIAKAISGERVETYYMVSNSVSLDWDEDGKDEILYTMGEGTSPINCRNNTVMVCDLKKCQIGIGAFDGSGYLRLLRVDGEWKVITIMNNMVLIGGTPIDVKENVVANPIIADVTGDKNEELIIAVGKYLIALDFGGDIIGYAQMGDRINLLAAGDFDIDGKIEVIAITRSVTTAYDTDGVGKVVWGIPGGDPLKSNYYEYIENYGEFLADGRGRWEPIR